MGLLSKMHYLLFFFSLEEIPCFSIFKDYSSYSESNCMMTLFRVFGFKLYENFDYSKLEGIVKSYLFSSFWEFAVGRLDLRLLTSLKGRFDLVRLNISSSSEV